MPLLLRLHAVRLPLTLTLILVASMVGCREELTVTLDGFGDDGAVDAGPAEGGSPEGGAADRGRPDMGDPDGPTAVDQASADQSNGDQGKPAACGASPRSYSGSLCGPGTSPCKVKVNEVLPGKAGFRNRQPALALDAKGAPRVLFSLAVGGYSGHLGARGAAGWTVTSTPFALAMGDLERDTAGGLVALTHDGATKGGELWRHAGTTWTKLAAVTPSVAGFTKAIAGWPAGLELDSGGCAHLGIYDLAQSEAYLRRSAAGGWTKLALASGPSGTDMKLALASGGAAHVAQWAGALSGSGWQMLWHVPGLRKPEAILPGGASPTLKQRAIGIAVTGSGIGTPHLLFARGKTVGTELTYATRGAVSWTLTKIATDGAQSCGKCAVGATCNYDYYTYEPHGVIAAGGADVRLLWSRARYTGPRVGTSMPPKGCYWKGGKVTGDLMLGWPTTGGAVGQVVLLKGASLLPGTVEAEVDKAGDIHLAIYASSDASTNTVVRYLKIGK